MEQLIINIIGRQTLKLQQIIKLPGHVSENVPFVASSALPFSPFFFYFFISSIEIIFHDRSKDLLNCKMTAITSFKTA